MDNFVFGIQSIARGIGATIIMLAGYQVLWGFALGFFVSTLMHGFLITDSAKHIPTMLLYSPTESFQKLNARKDAKGTYQVSYSQFQKTTARVKFVFGLTLLLFLVIILLSLLRY